MGDLTRKEIKDHLALVIQQGNLENLEEALDSYDSSLDLSILNELLSDLSKIRQRKLRQLIKTKILDSLHRTVIEPIMASL